jgi:hypothetical protein
MRTSNEIDKICEALAKAQGEMKNPEKNRTVTIKSEKTGREFSFDYADLPECFNVNREVLSKHGLSHSASPVARPDGFFLVGRLLHSSGQFFEGDFPLPEKGEPKTLAGVITYAKRYLFCSLTGVAGEEDVDTGEAEVSHKPGNRGNVNNVPQGTGKVIAPKQENPPGQPAAGSAPDDQKIRLRKMLFAVANEMRWSQAAFRDYMKQHWGIESTNDLTPQQFTQLIDHMKKNHKLDAPEQGVGN